MSKAKSAEREYIRIATAEGIESPRIERGNPHARLIGTVRGQEVRFVVSLSRGAFSSSRQQAMTICNFRRAVRAVP